MANTTHHTIVELNGVSKTFANGTTALSGFDISVQRGDFLCLLGASGCGKSTVLRLLADLDVPSSGNVMWSDTQARESLSMVLQEATLLPWATVDDNVWMPLRIKGISKTDAASRIATALELVGLSDSAALYPRELSGGMKMRVSLARALVSEPSVLLLDEPFAALDEITRFRLNDELLTLRGKLDCTVIFVTHSVFESAYLANRVAVMDDMGKISEEIAIDAPYPRTSEFRSSSYYTKLCAKISAALERAA
ncbi:ABC transporter ATP-binding protein [Pseudahrensia aquimaris]|uniref:ABC transporter ATP-binding protein n=1 Tax=Pseudahrensia aquimaris TaxID=744461 RepID=A0ABW3FC73_9HYPH